ncbi:hypothetical protein H5410_006031 [Solanum commersonii]|uniref:Uncharacterized protein n=1 Tax=Solanum commersonii TaxID=4109 RepID=A0A9J6A883_SOLCO|nr:hypothetical protein H5410_006031 [Solanum commersonii]
MVVLENTIFRARQKGPIPSGTWIINFVGDHNGVCLPSNLLYSPTNLTWKGKTALTQGQLEMQNRQKKIKKLKPRKGQKLSIGLKNFLLSWVKQLSKQSKKFHITKLYYAEVAVCMVFHCFHGDCGLCTLVRLQAMQKDHMVMNWELNVQPLTQELTKQA